MHKKECLLELWVIYIYIYMCVCVCVYIYIYTSNSLLLYASAYLNIFHLIYLSIYLSIPGSTDLMERISSLLFCSLNVFTPILTDFHGHLSDNNSSQISFEY